MGSVDPRTMNRLAEYSTQPASAFVMITTVPTFSAAARHQPTCSSRAPNCSWSGAERSPKLGVLSSFSRSIHELAMSVSSQSNTITRDALPAASCG